MTRPPGGSPPPQRARLQGDDVDLLPLAEAIAAAYFEAYPEDLERYGDAGRDWEIHDTLHLLNWAIADAEGHEDLAKQVTWLAGVLHARDFPLEHLAGNLEIAGEVVGERLPAGAAVAERLRAAAVTVRELPP